MKLDTASGVISLAKEFENEMESSMLNSQGLQ